ncbi:unnamed protein product [Urochloa humidicola]
MIQFSPMETTSSSRLKEKDRPRDKEGLSEGQLNAVEANQDPNQASEDQHTNFEFEGNPLEEVAANPWPYQFPPGRTIEWDSTDAK